MLKKMDLPATESRKYWDYIALDGLLSLQQPLSNCRTEKNFIVCHQIIELVLSTAIDEIDQIVASPEREDVWREKSANIASLAEQFVSLFVVMMNCVDPREFGEFRKSLAGASGFQSFSFRKLELASTSMDVLALDKQRVAGSGRMVHDLYWYAGASVAGKIPAMLTLFMERYEHELIASAEKYHENNLNFLFDKYSPEFGMAGEIECNLHRYDETVNALWRRVHVDVAKKFIASNEYAAKESTGRIGWERYLASSEKLRFFPGICAEPL